MENEMLTSEVKENRSLATVLFTDCVGFSARMSMNEEHTLALIRRDLKLMTHICESYKGRVLKSTGDGLLMCFSSAVKAVECAIAIQEKIAEAIRSLPPSDTLMHRIGIHLADMYITQSDVMGNGVNIAARLQTEADPGGICISQTVYDVAKSVLQLETEYLGPRELKNIREVVPAYRVLVDKKNAQNDPYAETVRFLQQSSNLPRIRKLIFYTCKNHWENDDAKLANLSLKGIIHEFLGLASSYEQLRGLLNSAVAKLSKQSEYSLVAKEILQGVAKFYPSELSLQPEPEQLLTSPIGQLANLEQSQVQLIARQIDQHLDSLRLKKLLYYICYRQWASDVSQLQATSTVGLLERLRVLATTMPQLDTLVHQYVQTLNKQAEYSRVATTLLGLVSSLYGQGFLEASTGSPDGLNLVTEIKSSPNNLLEAVNYDYYQHVYQTIATALEQNSNRLRIKKLLGYLCTGQWLKDTSQVESVEIISSLAHLHRLAPTPKHLDQALTTTVNSLSKQAEYTAVAQILMQAMHPIYTPGAIVESASLLTVTNADRSSESNPPQDEAAQAPDPVSVALAPLQAVGSPSAAVDMFDIRLGILKYTNPLKAKILAFSVVHSEFKFTEQDWFNLKMYDLDELFRSLLKTYQNFTDLEYILYKTARALEQPDELVQTADTLVKYLRSYYIHGSPSLLVNHSATAETRITLDEFEAATEGLGSVNPEDQTCGLVPIPPSIARLGVSASNADLKTRLLSSKEQESMSREENGDSTSSIE